MCEGSAAAAADLFALLVACENEVDNRVKQCGRATLQAEQLLEAGTDLAEVRGPKQHSLIVPPFPKEVENKTKKLDLAKMVSNILRLFVSIRF